MVVRYSPVAGHACFIHRPANYLPSGRAHEGRSEPDRFRGRDALRGSRFSMQLPASPLAWLIDLGDRKVIISIFLTMWTFFMPGVVLDTFWFLFLARAEVGIGEA